MESNSNLLISDSALAQLKIVQVQHPEKRLRIEILPGGCNGFEYELKLDAIRAKDDVVLAFSDDVEIWVDKVSLDLIQGATLDFESSLVGANFKIINPKAATSCGCGNSFSL
jgi:iron-sulfur cluster insertion protein